MERELRLIVKNSELKVHKTKRAFLTYPMFGLAPCKLEELEDGIALIFETDGFRLARDILKETKDSKLRFLLNCAALEKLYSEYEFSLSPDNLLADINLLPYALVRDAHLGRGAEFLPKYKALVGAVLFTKYTYDDFINSGQGLYEKNKFLKQLSKLDNTQEIKNLLLKEYNNTIGDIQRNKKLVTKRSVRINRIAIPFLSVSFFVAVFFVGRFFIMDIPYRDSVIAAGQAYVAGNFLDVQQALAGIPVSGLTHETKHILSRAYVITEPLSDAQINNILTGLTLITDTSIFDYWIHMGRLEFAQAIDIAQRFGDNELLLFAYLKYEAVVRADPHMPGEEKLVRLSYIENHINNLQAVRENAAGSEVFENLLVIAAEENIYYAEEPQEESIYDTEETES